MGVIIHLFQIDIWIAVNKLLDCFRFEWIPPRRIYKPYPVFIQIRIHPKSAIPHVFPIPTKSPPRRRKASDYRLNCDVPAQILNLICHLVLDVLLPWRQGNWGLGFRESNEWNRKKTHIFTHETLVELHFKPIFHFHIRGKYCEHALLHSLNKNSLHNLKIPEKNKKIEKTLPCSFCLCGIPVFVSSCLFCLPACLSVSLSFFQFFIYLSPFLSVCLHGHWAR